MLPLFDTVTLRIISVPAFIGPTGSSISTEIENIVGIFKSAIASWFSGMRT